MLAEFCLGALAWSPKVFWQEANLQDIALAMAGYSKYQLGITENICPPSKDFLDKMLKVFPDEGS